MNGRMTIAVVEPDGSGGLVHYAYQLCDGLASQGADVTLFTGRHYELADLPHGFDLEPIIDLWPAVAPVGGPAGPLKLLPGLWRRVRRIGRAFRYAVAWERLTRELIRRRPDVILFSVVRFPIQAIWLRRLRRRGLVLAQICHEFERRESRFAPLRGLIQAADRAAYPSFSAIFLHGEANRQAFHRSYEIPEAITHSIPHGDESLFVRLDDAGGDLRKRYQIPPGRPVVLFFGGIRPSKGVPDLIDAFATARRDVEASLLIAGRPVGVDVSELLDRAAASGIAGDVTIDAGYLPMSDIGPLMRTATVVVLPYRSATASGVLQTAYAFSRPVIATDVGALPEAVEDGVTGLIVPSADPAALSRAIVKIVGDPAEAERMGAEGRRLAELRYGWTEIAGRISHVFRNIAGGAP